jgi:DNA-binding response OmpR family regulator
MRDAPVVLLIDDDPLVRTTLAMELRWAGFQVLEAADGQQALRHGAESRPDIAVVDVMLGNQCGIRLLQQLRRDSPLPCVVLTGLDDEETAREARAAGAIACVRKPVDPLALGWLIEDALQSS